MSPHKDNLILINKADFLTEEQRQSWADYFSSISVRVAFFSATLAAEEDNNETVSAESSDDSSSEADSEEERTSSDTGLNSSSDSQGLTATNSKPCELHKEQDIPIKPSNDKKIEEIEESNSPQNSGKLLSRKDLISFLKIVHHGKRVTENVVTIGLVGYPNVGKSSTINSLLAEKKVSVSATPGKTKHFQVSTNLVQ